MRVQPVMPSKVNYCTIELGLARERALRFVDLGAPGSEGLSTETYRRLPHDQRNDEYPSTHEIEEVAHFLDFDGLIAPSARSETRKVVVFCAKSRLLPESNSKDHDIVDWVAN